MTGLIRSKCLVLMREVGVVAFLGGLMAAPCGLQAEPEPIVFNRDIRPLLSNNCFFCHGPDEVDRGADLRLDVRDHATANRKGGAAIVPGDFKASELRRRLLSTDPDTVMPPPDSGKSLTPEQIALIGRWIDEGAAYQEHWSYVAPQRPAVPTTQTSESARNEIDAFVADKLASHGLSPSRVADPATLLRRLALDLTGLPPKPEDVAAFVADPGDAAYNAAVERLLASPAFGERMAVHWLDQVRYADTTGYHSDETQPVWAYRDYVIAAFNSNMPFDQFTREQLAGDLLPNATDAQKIASGFNRLNQTTAEGGAQAKEYLAKYMADRVRAVSTVWMGATLGCAECHDHKYDPYTARDFYSFGAFFADIDQRGQYRPRHLREPVIELPTEAQAERLATLRKSVSDLDAAFKKAKAEATSDAAFRAWFDVAGGHVAIEQAEQAPPEDVVWIDDKLDPAAQAREAWDYTTAEDGPVHSGELARRQLASEAQLRVQHVFMHYPRLHAGAAGDRWFVYVWLDPENPPKQLMLQFNSGQWIHRAYWGDDEIVWGKGTDDDAHRRLGPLPKTGEWVRLEVPAEKVGLAAGQQVNGLAFTQFGGLVYWDQAGVLPGAPQAVAAAEGLDAATLAIVQTPFDQLENKQLQAARASYNKNIAAAAYKADEDALKEARKTLQHFRNHELYASLITRSVEPAVTRVLPRGNWMDETGEVVQPAVPAFMRGIETEGRATRLDLANWFLGDDQPLTSRVFVNRMWKLFFGRGLAPVLDDLGNQGGWPTHPELLDWLAVEFRESGWDMKHIVRLMVTSRTYRQSSQPTAALAEADTENHLYGRQARFRLEAEFIRDNALAISGLLHAQVGGPTAKPYQPAGYYQHLNFPRRTYDADKNASQYRRGVYMHWQRTFLHPMLMNFDAPSREECVAERSISNTPLQALTLLNDPTFVEAARVFAARIMREGGTETRGRAAWAFEQAVARPPASNETGVLAGLYEQHHAWYAEHPDQAAALAKNGMSPQPGGLNTVELAAWTSVARVVLNLHETITRD